MRFIYYAKDLAQRCETPAVTARAVRRNKPRVARVAAYAVPAQKRTSER